MGEASLRQTFIALWALYEEVQGTIPGPWNVPHTCVDVPRSDASVMTGSVDGASVRMKRETRDGFIVAH